MRRIRRSHNQFDSPKSHFIGTPDRIIYQLEAQGPCRVRRPLTTGFEIQSCSNVPQKCSHISSITIKEPALGSPQGPCQPSSPSLLPQSELAAGEATIQSGPLLENSRGIHWERMTLTRFHRPISTP